MVCSEGGRWLAMERLRDDDLLLVLQRLAVADLLACRLVCKRLAALALHPDAWRRRRLTGADARGRRACAVLRLAPCLAEMDVTLPGKRDVGTHQPPYATTRCAVRSLRLDAAAATPELTALVIRNQVALGGLRRLHLVLSPYKRDPTVVLETLASADGLQRLLLYNNPDLTDSDFLPDYMTLPLHATLPQPSLRFFECHYEQSSQLFIDFMLAAHAATLEEVDLGEHSLFEDSNTTTARLLGGIPNLRKLSCPLLPDLSAAGAGGALRELDLYIRPGMMVDVTLGARLLRRARQLRKVSLVYDTDGESDYACAEVILALGPSVETLVVWLDDLVRAAAAPFPLQLRALRAVLPSLRQLAELELNTKAVTEDLVRLLDITPSSAPALRRLELSGVVEWTDSVRCPHYMVHRWDAMGALMRENPRLYVALSDCSHYSCCLDGFGDDTCDVCKLSCMESETSECWILLNRLNG
ncbi:Protein NLRC5 [Frankliniella fusca]|uniref:Protein NLRC5 n=1 Tax=Frankliniella fusca TaxID=407009 RepID=A0AAE1L5V7_9NEOP|nr:Protein NLRC5 [Frankliniella fusca]